MKRKHKRLTFALIGLLSLGGAVGLGFFALEDSIVYFHSPTSIIEKNFSAEQRIRLGGVVEADSVERQPGATLIRFRITDLVNSIAVEYDGILPDLFREDQGVVVEGFLVGGLFRAEEVLAKHDETYMPPEAAEALKASGKWQHFKDTMTREPTTAPTEN